MLQRQQHKAYWIRKLEEWPQADTSRMTEKAKDLFRKRKLVLSKYFQKKRVKKLCQKFGTGRGEILRLAKRCLVLHKDGQIYGWRALVPGTHVNGYFRTAKSKRHGGCSGEFKLLMERYPTIKDNLLNLYLKRHKRDCLLETRIQFKDLHKKFLDLCRSEGIPQSEYPFKTKQLAFVSLFTFLKSQGNQHLDRLVLARHGHDARKQLETGVGMAGRASEKFLPYELVVIDGHRIDGIFTIEIMDSFGRPVDVVVERPWILCVMDMGSRAILSWRLCIRTEYTQVDVLLAFKHAIVPLIKKPDSSATMAMPSEAYEELAWGLWGQVAYDNAKAHLSETVREKLIEVIGCSVNAGPVATPTRRAVLERFFRTLEENGFHRLPNTTGCNPTDIRRTAPEENALKYKIKLDELNSLLDQIIRDYNNTPHSGMDYRTPMEVLGFHLRNGLIIRKLDAHLRDDFSLLGHSETRVVKGSQAEGRRPYIEYKSVRYTNSILAYGYHLVGEELSLQINPEDLRTIKAFFPNGHELGLLTAHGRWGTIKHDMEMRLTVNSLKRRRVIYLLEHEDPVAAYIDHKNKAAKTSKRTRSAVYRAKTLTQSTETEQKGPEKALHRPESLPKTLNIENPPPNFNQKGMLL
jgi:transposase InsO family protein